MDSLDWTKIEKLRITFNFSSLLETFPEQRFIANSKKETDTHITYLADPVECAFCSRCIIRSVTINKNTDRVDSWNDTPAFESWHSDGEFEARFWIQDGIIHRDGDHPATELCFCAHKDRICYEYYDHGIRWNHKVVTNN